MACQAAFAPPGECKETFVGDYIIGDGVEAWPEKAYKNLGFLNSRQARAIRIMCEYMEPLVRFEKLGVTDTIVFFGSARTLDPDVARANLAAVEAVPADTPEAARCLADARRDVEMSRFYDDARQLASRLTTWAKDLEEGSNRFAICSGGGPGIMEAANRGAAEAGGPSIGLNISLPFEQRPNPYQSHDLSFEFHYFFIRKFWFMCPARALVIFPGGYGTMDELFELLTLTQTGKSPLQIPIVIFGSEFWSRAINFEYLAESGVIERKDLELFHVFDDVTAAFEFLRDELTRSFLGMHCLWPEDAVNRQT